jgi:glycerate kinase
VAVADAIATGWLAVRPDDAVTRKPMADGGEGTLAALLAGLGDAAQTRSARVHGPHGDEVDARWLLLDDGRTAFIEMAEASGLRLVPSERRTPDGVRGASTRGTGELIRAALDAGVERVVVGLGGSATNDGGAGLLRGIGALLLDNSGGELPDGGAALARLATIDASALDPRLGQVELVVASDVTNPLCGPRGASATYGPQKGADDDAVAELDAALLGFTRATLRPGAELIGELIGLADALEAADLVLTGEGRADEQTLQGKAAFAVATLARARATPVILLCGALGPGGESLEAVGPFAVVQPIADGPMPLEAAMADTDRLLHAAAARIARLVGIGLGMARD